MKAIIAVAVLLLHFACAGAAMACSLPAPKEKVILSIEGLINNCNDGFEVRFDLPMLESLPKRVIKTENPWEHGLVTYEGVLLRDVLDYVGADGQVITLTALNDYRAEIPVADARSIDVILAYKRDGEYMSVREKGPLFVVFPFTDNPKLSTEDRFAQSVWQVNKITLQ